MKENKLKTSLLRILYTYQEAFIDRLILILPELSARKADYMTSLWILSIDNDRLPSLVEDMVTFLFEIWLSDSQIKRLFDSEDHTVSTIYNIEGKRIDGDDLMYRCTIGYEI